MHFQKHCSTLRGGLHTKTEVFYTLTRSKNYSKNRIMIAERKESTSKDALNVTAAEHARAIFLCRHFPANIVCNEIDAPHL